jgi:hypothetical protein
MLMLMVYSPTHIYRYYLNQDSYDDPNYVKTGIPQVRIKLLAAIPFCIFLLRAVGRKIKIMYV